jgi:hypothetical protein
MRSIKGLALTTISASTVFVLSACSGPDSDHQENKERWLAGDHHIHSRFSTDDAIYPIPLNALMSRHFGLAWIVATDHGGPDHSRIRFEQAYPELQMSRAELPEVIQFYGIELNSPAADHSSIIMPFTSDESLILRELESRFDTDEVPSEEEMRERDQEDKMIQALQTMDTLEHKPVVIAHHPARSAPALGEYGDTEPRELRNWNDAAPDIAVGMEGAPGHQAGPLSKHPAPRGWYYDFPTMGGYDQMTARLGGVWDAMLGEGRRWWVTANSDSHRHYTDDTGVAFWPGEYAKTYVYARKDHASILESLRRGRIFVTTGDLVSELDVSVIDVAGESDPAMIGGTIALAKPGTIEIRIQARDPGGMNFGGHSPTLKRVDLIIGNVTGRAEDRTLDTNDSTKVLKRFYAVDWQQAGEQITMSQIIKVSAPIYIRVRGTNTDALEPDIDPPDEDPWPDLWFYSNPIFVEVKQ